MSNLTQKEWKERLPKLGVEINKRYPSLAVEVNPECGEIQLRTTDPNSRWTEVCSGVIDLRSKRTPHCHVHVAVTSGAALAGELSQVELGVAEYKTMLKALHYLKANTGHLSIWGEGECPCDYCGETGKLFNKDCPDCEGKGVR